MLYRKTGLALALSASFGLLACGDSDNSTSGTAGDIDFAASCEVQKDPFKTITKSDGYSYETTVSFKDGIITTITVGEFNSQALAKEACKDIKKDVEGFEGFKVKCEGKTVTTTITEEGDEEDYEYAIKGETQVCNLLNNTPPESDDSKSEKSSSSKKIEDDDIESSESDDNIESSESSDDIESSESNDDIESSDSNDDIESSESDDDIESSESDDDIESSESDDDIKSSSSSQEDIDPEAFTNFDTEQCKGKENGTKISIGGIPFTCMNGQISVDEDGINELIGNKYKGCEDSKIDDDVWVFYSSPMGSWNTEKITWLNETSYEHKSFPVPPDQMADYEELEELGLGPDKQIINDVNREEVYAKYCGQ